MKQVCILNNMIQTLPVHNRSRVPSPPPSTPTEEQSPSANNAQLADFSLEPLDSSAAPTTGSDIQQEEPEVTKPIEDEVADTTRTMEIPKDTELQEKLSISGENESPLPEIEMQPVPEIEMQSDPDQTFHGVNLDKTFNSALYEDTVQGEPFKPEDFAKSYDETLPGVPAAQLAKDIGTQDQPTPVAAQTIFTATNTIAKPTSGFRLLLISLALLAVISAFVASYFFVTPVNRDITSPIVARGVETIIAQSARPATPAPLPQSLPEQTITEGELIAETIMSETTVSDPEEIIDDESVAELIVQDTESSEIQMPEQVETIADGSSENLQVDPISTPPGFLPEVIEPPSSMIKITRSSQSGQSNQKIRDAFEAYQSGNYAQAQIKYTDALNEFPDSRDAVLGMAAVALQTGRQDQAMGYYLQLLRKNPLDNIARAAFLGQQGGSNSLSSISQLKTLIYDAPDQPYLFFTLGKLYAGRDNWSEAQQAFFEAYRLDSSNPDFALNLAISLDRLGQRLAALDYYSVAVRLSENTAASFDRSIVQNRIDTLTTGN